MSRPLIAKDSKAKGDKLMKNVRSSGGASRKSPVKVQYTTASGTPSTGTKPVDVPVDINPEKVRKVLVDLQEEQVSPSKLTPPVLPIQGSTETDLPPANLNRSPPKLRRKTSRSSSLPLRTVDTGVDPIMSTGVPTVPVSKSSVGSNVGSVFEKAFTLAQTLRPNLDHASLLAFAGKLLSNNSAPDVSDSAPPSSTSPRQVESVPDVRHELRVQPVDTPSQRRRALLSEAQVATGTPAKRRRVDDRYGDNDDASPGRTHSHLFRPELVVNRPSGLNSPSPVSEGNELPPSRPSSPHYVPVYESDEDENRSEDTGASQHRASAMVADDSSYDSDDVDDAGKHQLRRSDLTAAVYRLYPEWEPSVSQAELPATGAAQLFGDTQAWVRKRKAQSLPHSQVVKRAFDLVHDQLRDSAKETDQFRSTPSVSTKSFNPAAARSLTGVVFPVHAPVFAAGPTVMEPEAESLGLRHPTPNSSVSLKWKSISDLEVFLKNSLSNLSAVDVLSSSAFAMMNENLAGDVSDAAMQEIGSLYMAMSESLQRACTAISMTVANLVLAKRDSVIPTRTLPGESATALRCAPVTSCHLFAKQSKALQKDVESLQHLKQLRRLFETPSSGRVSSSSSSLNKRQPKKKSSRSTSSSTFSSASFSQSSRFGIPRGRGQRRGQGRNPGSSGSRAQASSTKPSYSQQRRV